MCSNSRVEELVVVDLFLPHLLSSGPSPASDGKARTYLEIGANDGLHASNTLYLSNCLRWEGILIEAHPVLHTRIMANRPSTVSINTAVCTQHQVVQFSAEPVPGGSMLDTKTLQPLTQSAGAAMTLQKQIQQTDWSAVAEGWDEPPEEVVSTQQIANATIEVACGPLQYYLDLLGVSTLHFFSLDVEGAEAHVVNSIDWKRTTVAILVVEESTRTPSMRSKNAKVQGVLKSEARMRQVYKHCIHSQLCDTYWVNPKLIDVKGVEGSLAALNTQGNRTYKAKLLRDRMGTHIMRNNERCGRLKEEEEQEEVKVKGAAKPRARRKEKHPEKRNRLFGEPQASGRPSAGACAAQGAGARLPVAAGGGQLDAVVGDEVRSVKLAVLLRAVLSRKKSSFLRGWLQSPTHQFDPARSVTFNRFGIGHARTADLK